MFQNLRQQSLIYVLDKRALPEIVFKTGRVSAVTAPVPKYSPNVNPLNPLINGVETTVDISVDIDGQNVDFKKVPSNLSIYGDNGILISENKDAVCAEIDAMRDSSRKRIEGVDNDKKIIEQCDIISAQLNPSIAKEREREDKMNTLETRMNSMEAMLAEMSENIKSLVN